MSGNYGTQGAWEWNFWNRMGEGHLTNNAAEGGNNRIANKNEDLSSWVLSFCSSY